jgi:hypothetical protein
MAVTTQRRWTRFIIPAMPDRHAYTKIVYTFSAF